MTCCALGDQDAILGHVASRGDRFPRTSNKLLAVRAVNPVLESGTHSLFLSITNSSALMTEF
jgi:hypothetical protein